jgi:glucose-1-phosphate cytidylyltransferase
MKVVLFCGGLGTRLREHSGTIPKPLVTVGQRPIVWHLMRYYAHFGHKDFILCLGYGGEEIRKYFLNYSEALSNDFTLTGGTKVAMHSRDIDDWKITFVDTGLHSNIGQRLLRARPYLDGDDMFLANYADGLSDLPLDLYLDEFKRRDATAGLVAVRSAQSFHAVHADADGVITHIGAMPEQQLWINGGFFVLRRDIFDHVREGEELVEQPFGRLIQKRRLFTYKWDGFWQCMDTFKDKITFDRREARGECPWMIWARHPALPTIAAVR